MRTRAQVLQEKKGAPATEKLGGLEFFVHECGLKLARGAKSAICPLCEKPVVEPGEGTAQLPPEKPTDPDPWTLKPESVDTSKAQVETRVSTQQPQGADDKDFATLAAALAVHGYAVPIPMLAKMTTKERNACSVWADQPVGVAPDCLLPWSPKQTKIENAAAMTVNNAARWPDYSEPARGTVTAHWGEEKFGLKGSFSSCSVGPFTLTLPIQDGEPPAVAMQRALAELEGHAERERERKIASFVRALKEAFAS